MRNLILYLLGFLIIGNASAQNALDISLSPGNVVCVGEEVSLTIDYNPIIENNGKFIVYLIKSGGQKDTLGIIDPIAPLGTFPATAGTSGGIFVQYIDTMGITGGVSDTVQFISLDLQPAISRSCEGGIYSLKGMGQENLSNIAGISYGWVVNDNLFKDNVDVIEVEDLGKYVFYISYDTINYGCYSGDSIIISSLPTIQNLVFNNSENAIKCINQEIQQSVSLDTTFYTLSWSFDSNPLTDGQTEVEFQATTSGEKLLVLEVTDTVHMCSVTLTDTIRVADNPSVNYAFVSLNDCDSFQLVASVEAGAYPSGMGISSHRAVLPSGYLPDTLVFLAGNTFDLLGPYNLNDSIWVSYSLENSSGCRIMDSVFLDVPNFDPRCALNPSILTNKVCVGDELGIDITLDVCPRAFSYALDYSNDSKTISISDSGMVSSLLNGRKQDFPITKFMDQVQVRITVFDENNLVCSDSTFIDLEVSEYPVNPKINDTIGCPGTSLVYVAAAASISPYWILDSETISASVFPVDFPKDSITVIYGDSSKHCVIHDTFLVRGFKEILPTITKGDDCLPLIRFENTDLFESWKWQLDSTAVLFAVNADASEFILAGATESLELQFVDENGCSGEYVDPDSLAGVSMLSSESDKLLFYSCGELSSLIALDSVSCFTWGRIDKLNQTIEYPIEGPGNQYLFASEPDTLRFTYFAVQYDCVTKECGDYFVFRGFALPDDPCLEEKQPTYSLYPNPSHGVSFIELGNPEAGMFTFRLRDAYARLIEQFNVEIQEGTDFEVVPLNEGITALSAGMYYVEVLSAGGHVTTLPLIIINQ